MKLRPTAALTIALLLSFSAIGCNSIFERANSGDDSNVDVSSLGRRLITGERVACALSSSAEVYCWGPNSSYWEYGAPNIIGSANPREAVAPKLASLSRGVGTHYCGVNGNLDAICWGRDGSGQLGRGGIGLAGNAYGKVEGGFKWSDISVGRLTTCGLSTTGTGYCWGFNQYGAIGTGRIPINAFVHTPSPVDSMPALKSISAGWLHSCAVTAAGVAWCWGDNKTSQLGISQMDSLDHPSPERVAGGISFASISLGSRYTCGISSVGDAYCWGANLTGQLGDGSTTERAVPVLVAGGRKYTQIVTSSGFADGALTPPPGLMVGAYGHTCALDAAGAAWCWGWNGEGQLGDGTTTTRLTPVKVSGDLTFDVIATGGVYTCGMKGNRVWCWGSNRVGQLGSGDPDAFYSAPRAVRAPFNAP